MNLRTKVWKALGEGITLSLKATLCVSKRRSPGACVIS